MTAFNTDGKVVSVNDYVTIVGWVTAVSGSGGTAIVTVETPLTTSTITCHANDCACPDHENDANHLATNIYGKHFGVVGEQISVLGVVTGITGSGATALLTVTLKTSGLSITVPSGACHSAQFNG